MRGLIIICISFILMGCSKLSSKFDTPQGQPPVITEKPVNCAPDFHRTCWSETVKEITSCLEKSQGMDKFQGNLQFCSNDAKKFVHFKNADELFSTPYDPFLSFFTFSFSANKNSPQECFSVEGTGNNLRIKVPGYQTLRVIRDEQGLSFDCLDGATVSYKKSVVDDCEKKNGLSSIPGVNFGPFVENGQDSGWRFSFRGANEGKEIFRCYY